MNATLKLEPSEDVANIHSAQSSQIEQSFDKVSSGISQLLLKLVEASGAIDHLVTRSETDRESFQSMIEEMCHMREANDGVITEVTESNELAIEANNEMRNSQKSVVETVDRINTLIDTVEEMSSHITEMSSALENVGSFANVISGIAKQTNLLALNATIEAARAGEAGKGFSVVASEVKALANSTTDATTQIEETVSQIRTGFEKLNEKSESASQMAGDVKEQGVAVTQTLNRASGSLDAVNEKTNHVVESVSSLPAIFDEISRKVEVVTENSDHSADVLTNITHLLRDSCDENDRLVVMAATSGAKIDDSEMIELAKDTAAKVSEVFSEAVNSGQISFDNLMDRNYRVIDGSNPVQYMTEFTEFTDRVLPEIQEKVMEEHGTLFFCATIDNNGYVPTHNAISSKPQGPDPVWNDANCRNRRIYSDRTGSRCGANKEPVLLQTFTRTMADGNDIVMKDVSSPVYVNGTHWGGVRLGYKV